MSAFRKSLSAAAAAAVIMVGAAGTAAWAQGEWTAPAEAQKMKDAIFVAVVRGVLAHYNVEE